MITKNMVKEGYNKGIINLIKSPNGDGIVCKIGGKWFYFGGDTAKIYDDVEEYKSATLTSDNINMIYESLKHFFYAGNMFEGMYERMYLYCECCLRQHGINGITNDSTTKVKLVECSDHNVFYGVLKVHNVTVEEIQNKIYEIKNDDSFLEEHPDWTIDDVFNQFPDDWEWEFINTSTDNVVEI